MRKRVFVVANELCNGCRNCEMWCSFLGSGKKGFGPDHSNIRLHTDGKGVLNIPLVDCNVSECSLNKIGEPICVEMCPTGCLIYTDINDLSRKKFELEQNRQEQPVFKLIAPWKYPYPWKRLTREEI